jgi:hypothetical protein
VHAVPFTDSITSEELERSSNRPAIREYLAEVVADGESELGYAGHTIGTILIITPFGSGVLGFQSLRAVAVRKLELYLKMGRAGLRGELG